MNFLTDKAFVFSKSGIFSYSDVLVWLGDKNRNSVRGLVKRAIASGEVLHIRRGLYCLAPKYNRAEINRFLLANLAYGPSYVSMETALSFHGWIPEAVHLVKSVSYGRKRSLKTPVGLFSYVQLKQFPLMAGVESLGDDLSPQTFLIAKPLKAVADLIASRGLDWTGSKPLEGSLRIEREDLESLQSGDFDELEGVYKSRRARRFLEGLRKELGK